MGVNAVVFDERAAPPSARRNAWFKDQRKALSHREWLSPQTSSDVLNTWFSEMRQKFPVLEDADPEDDRGTEYAFFPHFVDMDFTGPVAEEGIVTAWRLAHKHGLRMLVGSQLLPRSAPQGKRRVHIPVLDGSRIRDPDARRVSIAVLDPAFAPISDPNQWIRDQLGTQSASDDLSSLASDRLKRWFNEFKKIEPKGTHTEVKSFGKFILVHTRPADLSKVAPLAIELAKNIRVGLSFFEDL